MFLQQFLNHCFYHTSSLKLFSDTSTQNKIYSLWPLQIEKTQLQIKGVGRKQFITKIINIILH